MDVISNAEKMQTADKAVSVEGGEESKNYIKIRELRVVPPLEAAFGSTLASKLTCIMAKKSWRKIKLFASFVITTFSYKSGNTSNMSHFKRKHGIRFLSTASPSASNISKSDNVTKANAVTGQLCLQETFLLYIEQGKPSNFNNRLSYSIILQK